MATYAVQSRERRLLNSTQVQTKHKSANSTQIVNADRQLLASGCFVDLRAPVEFARGALPGAVNLPLMTDAEREQVGTAYVQQGKAAAIKLGHALVSGPVREARMNAWREHFEAHPEALLYCARGGLRSETVQHWLREAGIDVPRVAGGFKAIRQLCLDVLESAPTEKPFFIVGGRTGCGKTAILPDIAGAIDLEALANHRSSAFGGYGTPQPPQVGFENALATAFLCHQHATIVLEDESRSIGHVALPPQWYDTMRGAPLIVVESTMEERCGRIQHEYVDVPLSEGEDAEALHQRLAGAVSRIQRRLGSERHGEVQKLLDQAFEGNDHTPWIERLLVWYYDPAYDRSLEKKRAQIAWRGSPADAPAVLAELLDAVNVRG